MKALAQRHTSGSLFVFEGPDGVGKSTIATATYEALLERWRWFVQWSLVQRRVVQRRESRRLRGGGSVSYTAAEWRTIEPLARQAEEQAREHPDRRDLFLCHAWG